MGPNATCPNSLPDRWAGEGENRPAEIFAAGTAACLSLRARQRSLCALFLFIDGYNDTSMRPRLVEKPTDRRAPKTLLWRARALHFESQIRCGLRFRRTDHCKMCIRLCVVLSVGSQLQRTSTDKDRHVHSHN
ncbi:hypothetical protein EVAR_83060_1 [Eumeta japonica]|uniref:Uncharacterized protein n=1 Tax=Eumeta variegata TaxID=151549 RepID=A0A4C1VMK4_EUMVA|nr:hypothetical protein EVAR_83060_1 [Eumeta japonica]